MRKVFFFGSLHSVKTPRSLLKLVKSRRKQGNLDLDPEIESSSFVKALLSPFMLPAEPHACARLGLHLVEAFKR